MTSILTCSLHMMDVRLLKQFISAMQGGLIPDFKAEVARRAQRDLLVNWSQKVIRAAVPLNRLVSPDRWLLYTRLRPFFITTDDPRQAVSLAERFFTVTQPDDVVNLFREEVARIDADRADEIIDSAQQDTAVGPLPLFTSDEIANHLRAYLLYQRRQLESLASAAGSGRLAPEKLAQGGRLLAWRTCNLLANVHPSWSTRALSLTQLASRQELGLATLVADPRGMYAKLATRVPGLHEKIPYYLQDSLQTGLCVNPQAVPAVLQAMAAWPSPLPATAGMEAPLPAQVQALQEALLYAEMQQAGLWEADGMVNLEHGVYPQIIADQGDLDEQMKAATVSATTIEPAATAIEDDVISPEVTYQRLVEDTRPIGVEDPDAVDAKTPWLKRLFKK